MKVGIRMIVFLTAITDELRVYINALHILLLCVPVVVRLSQVSW